MFRIILILLLSFSLLFSCSKKDAKKPSVIFKGKVQEGGCKKFDFYCKRTGRVLESSKEEQKNNKDKTYPRPVAVSA